MNKGHRNSVHLSYRHYRQTKTNRSVVRYLRLQVDDINTLPLFACTFMTYEATLSIA